MVFGMKREKSNPPGRRPSQAKSETRVEQALDAKKAIQLALDSRLDELKMDHAMAAVRQANDCVGGIFWEGGKLLRVFEAEASPCQALGIPMFHCSKKKLSEVPENHSESAKHPI